MSAGAPIAGANVTVYAINDSTASIYSAVGNAGVIGTGGPTDSTGKAIVTLSVNNYSGPIQVVASGANLSYTDPCIAGTPSSPAPSIQIPSDFVLSSYFANYQPGSSITIPVDLFTTLADHEALAYASGRHPLHPGAKPITVALAARDPLFVQHITTSSTAWGPTTLRSTLPATMTASSQTLVDTAYAALFDIALNGLALDTAQLAGYASGSTAINAITLAQLLEQDLDADAVFNGQGQNGQFLSTTGTTPVPITSQFLRIPLAQALDEWVQNTSLNHTGIAQADLVSAGVFNAITQDNSDLFGAPPAGPYDPVDHTPPVLSLASSPTAYTNHTSVTLTVTATDPSGVQAVYAQNGSIQYTATTTDGGWQLSDIALNIGPNTITIWAVDSADPANSGLGLAPPYQLTVPILSDTTPPSIVLTDLPSYFSEAGMSVQTNSSGQAIVPMVPVYASATTIAVGAAVDVYKASTRLGWSTTPTAAELEQGNPGNIPFLQYAVTFNAQTDAPITAATYSVAVSCSGCNYAPATGNLWLSPTTSPAFVFFDLPLADNLIPALDTLPGPATITVTATAVDAAGNTSTTTPTSFTFNVIGSPVAIAQDTSYSTDADPKSTYPYTLAANNYADVFDPSVTIFLPENMVRLVHYIVTNPAALPVALTPPNLATSTWSVTESWPSGSLAQSNATYQPAGTYGTCGLPLAPCANSAEFFVPAGSSTPDCNAYVTPASTPPKTEASSTLSALAYYQQNGSDVSAASQSANARYIVPASNGSAPGVLSLYIVRPHDVTRATPITGAPPYRQSFGNQYMMTSQGACICEPSCGQIVTSIFADTWYYLQLTSPFETFSGQFQPQTFGLNGSTEFGEAATASQTLTVNATVSH